jgi:hypothetical protein
MALLGNVIKGIFLFREILKTYDGQKCDPIDGVFVNLVTMNTSEIILNMMEDEIKVKTKSDRQQSTISSSKKINTLKWPILPKNKWKLG